MAYIGSAVVPALIFAVMVCALVRGRPVFSEFTAGAAEGITHALRIFPSLLGLIVSIEMLKASGALDLLCHAAAPLTERLGLPSEILPLVLMRPVSGGAAAALTADIFARFGPDSSVGRLASVLTGSSETVFYVTAMYFGSVGIKDVRYTLKAALIANFCGFLSSAVIVRLIFG